jgi:sulfate/thiosulfate transport system permease protein
MSSAISRQLAAPTRRGWRPSALPGFGGTLALTIGYLSLVVLVPLATLVVSIAGVSFGQMWRVATSPSALAAYRLSFGGAFVAAAANAVFGLLVAWVLARYRFPGKGLVDAVVDMPLALPTAVAGIALTTLYAPKGLLGAPLDALGIKVAFAPLGVILAMVFVGIPFVVRTVQPVLMEIDPQMEEAAAVLGASRWQTFSRVLLPAVVPSLITGFALAFARALGEYGSVVFISGNLPGRTEIVPLLIATRLEEFDYPGAITLALVMLFGSFVLLLVINALQSWSQRRGRRGG